MSLEQDYTVVPGQLYACLSVVGPECPQKNDKFGIKIRGAFNSREEAASHAKRLQKEDAMAAKMFEERKRDMIESSANTFMKPGDENSKYYTKPDEPPISHPAEVLERLKKEKPDVIMEELVREADEIVANEIEERRKARETSVEAQDTKEDGEVEKGEEVNSN
jgi:hypothetical protein